MTNQRRDLDQLGQIPRDDDGPVFKEPWEAQAFALAVRLSEEGRFTWGEWATTLSDEIRKAQAEGDPDLGDTYYKHWVTALERLCAQKGLVGVESIGQRTDQWRQAYLNTPHGKPIKLASAFLRGPFASQLDRPQRLGILADERMMHPVDMGDWPLRIDTRRQLFVDDYLVASSSLTRTLHQPRKHPANPLLRPEMPWEADGVILGFVLPQESGDGYRMWYSSRLVTEFNGARMRFPQLYAESDDGISWRRPQLGIHPHDGRDTNIIIPTGRSYGLFHEPQDPDPERRYKAMVWHEPPFVPVEGYFLYTSADAIHWRRDAEQPQVPNIHDRSFPLGGVGDTSIFRWDELLNCYVGDVKFVVWPTPQERMRCRGTCESPDLVHWTRPRITLYPDHHDDDDTEIYGNGSFTYESMWLGMLRVMHTQRTGWKQVEVQLSASRDGRSWSRAAGRQEFLPLGDADSWDPDYSDPAANGPLLVGDELWFYYRGSRSYLRDSGQRGATSKSKYTMSIGLATLRRDGFVSLDAADAPASVTTRPLALPPGQLRHNARLKDGGRLRVAVLDRAGNELPGYGLQECLPVSGDQLAAAVRWRGGQLPSQPEKSHWRLRFELERGELFSFWVQDGAAAG